MLKQAISAVAIFVLTAAAQASERPNIVLVMADDQGWGDMAYNGHSVVKTPNFDEAATTGLRFDRFYAAAPVCSPTRASVLTGRHPNRMGVFQWGYPMRPQEVTLAEALKTVGYATGHFGKWHLGSVRTDSPASPGRNGFDEWLSAPNFFDNDAILSHRGRAVQTKGESSQVTVDAALDWIGTRSDSEEPFFAVVWFGSPHSPHQAIEEDRALYDDHSKARQHFYGEITGMDRAFGTLRDGLERLGIRGNTILWYCSDNGALNKVGSAGDHRGFKGDIYEGGLLVPAILEWPAKIPRPQSTNMRCNTCDIYPTLLEVADVTIDGQPVLDGVSLVPLIENGRQSRKRPMGFWNYPIPGIRTPSAEWMDKLLATQQQGGDLSANESSRRAAELPEPAVSDSSFPGHSAWIEDDWKLHRIVNKQGEISWELYHLAVDPAEKNDLLSSEQQRVEEMRVDLTDWLKSVVDSLNGNDYAGR